MRYVAIMLLVAGCTTQPLDIGTAVVIYPDVPAVGVSVDHTRPARVEHASAYLEIKGHYLELGVWENTDDTLIAVARQPEPPDDIVIPVQTFVRRPIPEPLWISKEQARTYAEAVFLPEDVDLMLGVADCEAGNADGIPSELNVHAKSPYSTTSGSFQHLRGWWSGTWGSFGAFDPYDPVQSFAAAAYLLYETSSGISNWNASKHCWW